MLKCVCISADTHILLTITGSGPSKPFKCQRKQLLTRNQITIYIHTYNNTQNNITIYSKKCINLLDWCIDFERRAEVLITLIVTVDDFHVQHGITNTELEKRSIKGNSILWSCHTQKKINFTYKKMCGLNETVSERKMTKQQKWKQVLCAERTEYCV